MSQTIERLKQLLADAQKDQHQANTENCTREIEYYHGKRRGLELAIAVVTSEQALA